MKTNYALKNLDTRAGTFVVVHLESWVGNQFPSTRERTYNAMIEFLASQDDQELHRLLDLGWWKVYDEMIGKLEKTK